MLAVDVPLNVEADDIPALGEKPGSPAAEAAVEVYSQWPHGAVTRLGGALVCAFAQCSAQ